jgi:hypothetical protein
LANLQAAHRHAADECLMLRYKNSLLERILLEKGISAPRILEFRITDSAALQVLTSRLSFVPRRAAPTWVQLICLRTLCSLRPFSEPSSTDTMLAGQTQVLRQSWSPELYPRCRLRSMVIHPQLPQRVGRPRPHIRPPRRQQRRMGLSTEPLRLARTICQHRSGNQCLRQHP